MSDEISIEDVFLLIAKLAAADGAAPLLKHPACWERRLDDHWTIAVNGHDTPQDALMKPMRGGGESGISVPPFHCYVEYNGWPAGLLSPFEGSIAAGDAANVEAFVQALRLALAARREVLP